MLDDSYLKAAHKCFETASALYNAGNALMMAHMEIEDLKAQLEKYQPKAKKKEPDPRQRNFRFDLDRPVTWTTTDGIPD